MTLPPQYPNQNQNPGEYKYQQVNNNNNNQMQSPQLPLGNQPFFNPLNQVPVTGNPLYRQGNQQGTSFEQAFVQMKIRINNVILYIMLVPVLVLICLVVTLIVCYNCLKLRCISNPVEDI